MRLQLCILTASIISVSSFVQRTPLNPTKLLSSNDDWQGEIVQGGSIRGCSIQQVGDSITDWTMTIDGALIIDHFNYGREEADLGRFSEAIYKKIMSDAKRERFQGFRPGTIPPHLEPTYRAFSMDECARETVLEAMEQNDIRPFTDARMEILIEDVSVPPPIRKGKKKKKNKKKKGMQAVEEEPVVEEVPAWKTYPTMKEAIDAGWKPGQSFSFVAKNVRGQRVLTDRDTKGAKPLGLNY